MLFRGKSLGGSLQVILNADDFGWDGDTIDTTIEAFNEGWLTSATLMTNMPEVRRALEFARQHPQFSYGVHLCFCSDGREFPLSPCNEIPDLARPNGQLQDSNYLRKRALFGQIDSRQIACEAKRQLSRMLEAGVPISHVDSHGHLHKIGSFRDGIGQAMAELGILRMRGVQDIYLAKRTWNATRLLGRGWQKKIEKRFKTTDHFYMPASESVQGWPELLLNGRFSGLMEVSVHPGRSEAWRLAELKGLARFAAGLQSRGIGTVTWNELRP
jgi:hypothetical protein